MNPQSNWTKQALALDRLDLGLSTKGVEGQCVLPLAA